MFLYLTWFLLVSRFFWLSLRPGSIAHLRACGQRGPDQPNNRVVILIYTCLRDCHSSCGRVQRFFSPLNGHRRVSVVDAIRKGYHVQFGSTRSRLERPILVASHIHRDGRIFGDQGPSEDSVCRISGVTDDANVVRAAATGDFFWVDAVPENDSIFCYL